LFAASEGKTHRHFFQVCSLLVVCIQDFPAKIDVDMSLAANIVHGNSFSWSNSGGDAYYE
jgi:hypothetical protein